PPDPLEVDSLRELCRWLIQTGRTPVVAEWPMGAHMDSSIHHQIESAFRPLISNLCREEGAHFISLSSGDRWDFLDDVHSTGAQGIALSRWYAERLRELGLFQVGE